MAIDIIARGMIESSKNDISQLFDITKGGEIVNNESSYTINNAVDYPLLGLNLYGKSTQDGTPSPEAPADIVSVGDGGSVEVKACGKNLLDYSLIRVVVANGVGFTNNNDGSFTVSGNKADTSKHFSAYKDYTHAESINILETGNYTLSSSLAANHNLYGYVNLYYNGNSYYSVAGTAPNGKRTFAITEEMLTYDDFRFQIGFYSPPNKDVITGTFNLQLEHGSTATDFEPYKGNIASITSALPLCGIPVSEGGNYTDGNGQRWVCDEVIYNADGTGKIIKRLGSFTIDGTEKFKTYDNVPTKEIAIISEKYNEIKQPKSTHSVPIIISDILSSDTAVNVWAMAKDNIIGIHYETVENKSSLRIYSTYFSSVDVAKSFFTDNPKNIIAELAEPREIELTAAEMAALRQLQTFDGVSNITTGSGADMDVIICTNKLLAKYVKPITTELQAQIDELKAAVLSLGGNV